MTARVRTIDDLAAYAAGSQPSPLSKKDVMHLGEADMRVLVARLRQSEASASERIGYGYGRQGDLKLLLDADRQALIDLAVDVKNLQAPVFGGNVPDSLWIGTRFQYPGHTTFRYCGHCEYASSFSARGVTCRFDPKGLEGGVPFASECSVIRWPKKRIVERLSAITKEIEREKVRREIIRTNIRFLQGRLPEAPKKPIDFRERRKHFNFGDRVRVYAYSSVFGRARNTWVPATVVATANGNEKVRVVCDERIISKRNERDDEVPEDWTRHSWGVYQRSPFILLEGEFAHFQEERKAFDSWLGEDWLWHLYDEASNTSYEPGRETFIAAFFDPREHRRPRKSLRMMSADEARALLGFESDPTDPKTVAAAYRSRLATGDEPTLRRAKDTLLTRIYGTKSIGG